MHGKENMKNVVYMYYSIKNGQLSDTAAVMHLPQVRNLQVLQKNLFESYFAKKIPDLWYTCLYGSTYLIS